MGGALGRDSHTSMNTIVRVIERPSLALAIRLRIGSIVERKIHEIGQVRRGGIAATHFGDDDQFAQDCIFQLELDAVHHCFKGDVDIEETGVLNSDDGCIHKDHNDVYDEELHEGAAIVASWSEVEEAHGFPGVDD